MANLADIFEELIQPADGNFSPELAQYVLSLKFSPAQIARYEDLADRVQEGKLSPDEKTELEAFVHANTILGIIKGKARRSLVQNTSAA